MIFAIIAAWVLLIVEIVTHMHQWHRQEKINREYYVLFKRMNEWMELVDDKLDNSTETKNET